MGLSNPVVVAGQYAVLPSAVPISVDVNGFVNVNATFSGSISGNAAAGLTGAAVPASADYTGLNVAGNLVGQTGLILTNATPATVAIVDGNGNQITSFGGGTQYADGVTQATPTGTIALGKNPSNVLHSLAIDAGGNLLVNVAAGGSAGVQFADNAASGATPIGTLSMGWDSINSKIRALKVDASQDLFVAFSSAQAVTLASTTITGTVTVSGTVTTNQGGAPWSVTFPSPQAVTLTSTTITGTVAVTQSTSPWVDNLTQVAGITLGATAIVNYGSVPAAVAVPAVNAFITNTVPVSGTVSVTNFANPLPVSQSGTWTVQQGTPPWSVTFPSAQAVTLTSTTITGTVAVTQSTSPWVVSGSGNFTVVQPTGTNLHVVVDSAPTTSVTQGTSPWVVSLTSTTITGTVAVTQSTSPWVENVSQFGGNNVVTGTGVSGAGIPRVTVSSDSFPATQPVSGTVTVANPSTNYSLETGGNLASIFTLSQNINQLLEAQREQLAVLKAILIQNAIAYGNFTPIDHTQFLNEFPIQ